MLFWLITFVYDRRRAEKAQKRALADLTALAPAPAPFPNEAVGSIGASSPSRPGQTTAGAMRREEKYTIEFDSPPPSPSPSSSPTLIGAHGPPPETTAEAKSMRKNSKPSLGSLPKFKLFRPQSQSPSTRSLSSTEIADDLADRRMTRSTGSGVSGRSGMSGSTAASSVIYTPFVRPRDPMLDLASGETLGTFSQPAYTGLWDTAPIDPSTTTEPAGEAEAEMFELDLSALTRIDQKSSSSSSSSSLPVSDERTAPPIAPGTAQWVRDAGTGL